MINILIVDDIDDNLTVLDMLIEEYMEDKEIEDYELFSYDNPIEGLKIAKKENIDIIFLDIMMPQLSGFDFLKKIREEKPLLTDLIIIMTTALGDNETKQKEENLGANGFMVKPVNIEVISVILDRYIPIINNKKRNWKRILETLMIWRILEILMIWMIFLNLTKK